MGSVFSTAHEATFDTCGFCTNQISKCVSEDFEDEEEVRSKNLLKMIQFLEIWNLEKKSSSSIHQTRREDMKRSNSIDSLDSLSFLSPCLMYEKAIGFYLSKRYEKAIEYLTLILTEMNPSNEEALFLRGKIYIDMEKHFFAERDFFKLSNDLRAPFFGLYGQAKIYLAHENYFDAYDLFEKITRLKCATKKHAEIASLCHLHMAIITRSTKEKFFKNSEKRIKEHIQVVEKLCPHYFKYIESVVKNF